MPRKAKSALTKLLLAKRKELQITQADIAKALGVATVQYGAWERNGKLPTDPARVAKIADILKVEETSLTAALNDGKLAKKRRTRKKKRAAATTKSAAAKPPAKNQNTASEPLIAQNAAAPAVMPDDAGEPMENQGEKPLQGDILPLVKTLAARNKPVTYDDLYYLQDAQIGLANKPLTANLIDALLEHKNS